MRSSSAVITAAILIGTVIAPLSALANPGRVPGPATVAEVSAANFLEAPSILAPASVYPLGKQSYRVVAQMLDRAVMDATGTRKFQEAWGSLSGQGERVGILVDAQYPPASLALLDALIDRLVRAGVRPASITVWADSETSLFSAGLLVRKDPDGVRTMGAESEGFRGGISRIVLEECDLLISLARLRADRQLGMWGATSTQLACVPRADRLQMMSAPEQLALAASRPSVRLKFRLHILDALQPNVEPGPARIPPYWNCGKVLASTDCVALDMAGLNILTGKMIEEQRETSSLETARQYLQAACAVHRLGQADPAQITVQSHALGE